MIFVLKPEVAAVVGPRAAREVNAAMQALTSAQLDGSASDAKLVLQRELFELSHVANEEMEP